MKLRALIVDDEPLPRLRLRDLLEGFPWVEVVGEATDGQAALAAIRDTAPDLVFLDIRMPGVDGLEVLRRAEPRPHAIFTTAFDRHAVAAFELHALDYLLKPFGAKRLGAALERVRETLEARQRLDELERLSAAFASPAPVERIFVRERGRILPLRLDDVEHLEADGDYVRLWVGSRGRLLRLPLAELEAWLDPERFLRIHRSHIVNLDLVTAFEPFDGSRLSVTLASGKRLIASRPRTQRIKERLRLR